MANILHTKSLFYYSNILLFWHKITMLYKIKHVISSLKTALSLVPTVTITTSLLSCEYVSSIGFQTHHKINNNKKKNIFGRLGLVILAKFKLYSILEQNKHTQKHKNKWKTYNRSLAFVNMWHTYLFCAVLSHICVAVQLINHKSDFVHNSQSLKVAYGFLGRFIRFTTAAFCI